LAADVLGESVVFSDAAVDRKTSSRREGLHCLLMRFQTACCRLIQGSTAGLGSEDPCFVDVDQKSIETQLPRFF
jgi:hypothetical protein